MVRRHQLVVWSLILALSLIIYVILGSKLAFLSFSILTPKNLGLG